MPSSTPYRLLVFDMDGTLVDSYAPIAECLNLVRANYGKSAFTLAEVRAMVGHGLENLIADAVGEGNVAEGVRIFRERYAAVGPESTVLLPGVAEALPALHGRGYTLTVATNKPAFFANQILRALALDALFSGVKGPELVRFPKPHPEMVERLMEENAARPSETLVVGDMRVDIDMARGAGVAVWAVATGSESREELERARPDRILDSLAEMLPLLPTLSP